MKTDQPMTTKKRDVVLWMIWLQTAILVLVSIGSLADRERIPKKFFPPEPLMIFCAFAMWITPLVVIATLLMNKSQQDKGQKLLISLVIAFVSVWAFLPMIQ